MAISSTPTPPAQVQALALAQALAQATDVLACCLLLLDARARLLHANRAALRLLGDGRWLQQTADGRITTRHPVGSAELHRAVARAAAGERQFISPPPQTELGLAALSPLAPTTHTDVITRDAQTPEGQPASGPIVPEARLVVLAVAGGQEGGTDLSGYAALHGLTPAEVRVLSALVRGLAPAELAQSLGVGLTTVRSQISALRRKTGRRNLVALLADVARLPPTRY